VVDPISAGLVVGAGWAGKKILGPSLDSIGDQLKGYSTERIQKILAKAEEKKIPPQVVSAVPNAFALRFFQSASMSEDDEVITELWANLLINSSISFDSRKLLYLDILDKISPADARILDAMVDREEEYRLTASLNIELDHIRRFFISKAQNILDKRNISHFDQDAGILFNDEILNNQYFWPVLVLDSEIPVTPPKFDAICNVRVPSDMSIGLANGTGPYDPLIRQRLLQEFDITFTAGFQMRVGGVMATALGIEFMTNCRGAKS